MRQGRATLIGFLAIALVVVGILLVQADAPNGGPDINVTFHAVGGERIWLNETAGVINNISLSRFVLNLSNVTDNGNVSTIWYLFDGVRYEVNASDNCSNISQDFVTGFFTPGVHTLVVYANDSSNNVSTKTYTLNVTIANATALENALAGVTGFSVNLTFMDKSDAYLENYSNLSDYVLIMNRSNIWIGMHNFSLNNMNFSRLSNIGVNYTNPNLSPLGFNFSAFGYINFSGFIDSSSYTNGTINFSTGNYTKYFYCTGNDPVNPTCSEVSACAGSIPTDSACYLTELGWATIYVDHFSGGGAGNDTTAPVITILVPTAGNYSSSLQNLSWTVTEVNYNGTFYITNVSGDVFNYSATYNNTAGIYLGLPDGDINITVYANDTYRNNASASVIVRIDNTTLTAFDLFLPANNSIAANNSPSFNWTNTSNSNFRNYTLQVTTDSTFATIGYYNNSYAYDTNYTLINAFLANETLYYWRVIAYDYFGHAVTSTHVYNYTPDSKAPVVALSKPANNTATTLNNLTFNFTVTEPYIHNCTLYGNFSGAFGANGSNQTAITSGSVTNITFGNLTNGSYVWNVKCFDAASNSAFNATNFTLTVDTVAPNITNATINGYVPVNDENITANGILFGFNVTDSNIDACVIWGNFGGSWAANLTNHSPVSKALTNFSALYLTTGNYNWTVWCNDTAGNGVWYASNFSFNFSDAIAPNVSVAMTSVADTDTDGNIELAWTDLAGEGSATYVIYRASQNITAINSTTTNIYNVSAGVQSFEDNTTAHNTTYGYAIVVKDAAGNINYFVVSNSLNSTANDAIAPAMLTAVTATNTSEGTIRLNWTPVRRDTAGNADNNVRYYVFRFNSSFAADTIVLTNFSQVNVAFFNATGYTTTRSEWNDTTTTVPGREYRYIVTVQDDGFNYNSSFLANNASETANPCNADWTEVGDCEDDEQDIQRICYGSWTTNHSTCDSGDGTTTPSGGSGGGDEGDDVGDSTTQEWDTMAANTATIMRIGRTTIAINKITVTPSRALSNTGIAVAKLDSRPVNATNFTGTVYEYDRIIATAIPDSAIRSVVIEIKVPQTWLESNNILRSELAMYRFSNNAWNKLTTTYKNTTGGVLYFDVATPGFSYFLIGKEGLPAQPGAPTCADEIRNQNETGVDCGGPCDPCNATIATCFDGIRNQNETGIDCGGPCAPCDGTLPRCDDGVKNGDETGVDCGGLCPACAGAGESNGKNLNWLLLVIIIAVALLGLTMGALKFMKRRGGFHIELPKRAKKEAPKMAPPSDEKPEPKTPEKPVEIVKPAEEKPVEIKVEKHIEVKPVEKKGAKSEKDVDDLLKELRETVEKAKTERKKKKK
ncbi:MAG: PGF-pre-PGF domain-containing protein [Nanoarchaeota archaeon]